MSVTGDVETQIAASMGGMDVEQSLEGVTSGEFHWDVERGLLHSSDFERTLEGTVNVPSMNMPPMGLKASGPVRTRIQN